MNRRSFLGLIPTLSILAAFPKKIFSSVPRYAEKFTDVLCYWFDGIKPDPYRARLFVDRDRQRIGIRSNSEKNRLLWEVPLVDVENLKNNRLYILALYTKLTCHCENSAERTYVSVNASLSYSGENLIVRFYEDNGRNSGHCEIKIKDVDSLLTRTSA